MPVNGSMCILLILVGLLTGCGGAARPTSSPPPLSVTSPLPAGHHIRTVFLIVMENHDWSSILGSPDAPYINHSLLPRASYARAYYNPPGLHPSLPNYLWLEAGTNCFPDTGCIQDDGDPGSHATHTRHHLTALLTRAGVSWRAYEENTDGSSCPLHSHTVMQMLAANGMPGLGYALYSAKHDPFVYFDDVTNNQSASSRICLAHIRPFSQLATDLRRTTVARYNVITPNVCDDMHTGCPMLSNRVRQGDRWLSRVVPAILASAAYRAGGAVFITWDEAAHGDGPIGLIALSPEAKGHGYSNAVHYTHSSLLRTIEEIFGVRPLLGGAAHAADLSDLFRRLP